MLVREKQNRTGRVHSGYTLMEMLVVVAIIVVLAGIGGFYLLPQLTNAKEDADLAQTKILDQAVAKYKIDNGEYPPNLEVLAEQRPSGPPYLEPHALEPKSLPNGRYQYDPSGGRNNGMKPDIWVEVEGKQIGNWMKSVPH